MKRGERKLVLSILKKIEERWSGVVAWSYETGNSDYRWREVAISSLRVYREDEGFRRLCRAWHVAAERRGFNIVFVCGGEPSEKRLAELASSDNLLLNVPTL